MQYGIASQATSIIQQKDFTKCRTDIYALWDPTLHNCTAGTLRSVSVRWPDDGRKYRNVSPLK
jgi:hypothetical protein